MEKLLKKKPDIIFANPQSQYLTQKAGEGQESRRHGEGSEVNDDARISHLLKGTAEDKEIKQIRDRNIRQKQLKKQGNAG